MKDQCGQLRPRFFSTAELFDRASPILFFEAHALGHCINPVFQGIAAFTFIQLGQKAIPFHKGVKGVLVCFGSEEGHLLLQSG